MCRCFKFSVSSLHLALHTRTRTHSNHSLNQCGCGRSRWLLLFLLLLCIWWKWYSLKACLFMTSRHIFKSLHTNYNIWINLFQFFFLFVRPSDFDRFLFFWFNDTLLIISHISFLCFCAEQPTRTATSCRARNATFFLPKMCGGCARFFSRIYFFFWCVRSFCKNLDRWHRWEKKTKNSEHFPTLADSEIVTFFLPFSHWENKNAIFLANNTDQ